MPSLPSGLAALLVGLPSKVVPVTTIVELVLLLIRLRPLLVAVSVWSQREMLELAMLFVPPRLVALIAWPPTLSILRLVTLKLLVLVSTMPSLATPLMAWIVPPLFAEPVPVMVRPAIEPVLLSVMPASLAPLTLMLSKTIPPLPIVVAVTTRAAAPVDWILFAVAPAGSVITSVMPVLFWTTRESVPEVVKS
jgi:hypothetical protein